MQDTGLTGHVFVITGSARGIGAATARTAAGYGARVMISDVSDDAGQAVVRQIAHDGGEAAYCHCDVSDWEQLENLMRVTAETFGGIDVLHNNAGIHETQFATGLRLEDMDLETFDRVLAVNLRGSFAASKAAVPYLKQSENPSIILAGSTASWVGYPMTMAYGPSKAAIALLTKNLAIDLAPYGIRANCYCPATVNTGMVSTFLDAAEDPESLEGFMVASHLVHRMGEPTDIAEMVCFLASRKASFVNGAVILIDGGSLAWRGTVDALGME